MAAKLSPTMQDALDKARANSGKLVRLAGGFWTYPGCPRKAQAVIANKIVGCYVPAWYVGVGTINALVERGFASVTGFAGNPPYLVEITIKSNVAPLAQTE